MTPNRYTYAWAAIAGAVVAVETVALLDRSEATLTHHVRSIACTRPRQVVLLAAVVWAGHHFALHDLRGR